jgi:hypothetical protein
MDGVATKPVAGANDMARFLRVVKEADLNQPATQQDPNFAKYAELMAKYDMLSAEMTPDASGVAKNASPEFVQQVTALKAQADQIAGTNAQAWEQARKAGSAPQQTQQQLATQLSEGANPHKVSLPVQMAMQHYQQPKVETGVTKTSSLLKQYFQETEDAVTTQRAEEQAIKQQRVRMYSQKIAERVLMKESRVDETPIAATDDPNDPMIHSHAKANPMTLKGRIQQARVQLQDLARMAESNDLATWEKICQLSKGGMFMGLEQNIEQVRHGIEQLAAKRKQGGVASRGIDKHIGEDEDPCWKDYKQIGMKKKGGKQVPNCVPKE